MKGKIMANFNELNSRYDVHNIPAWVISKNTYVKYAEAACLLAITDGDACFIRETEKALLFHWDNCSLDCCKVIGGEFWIAKSLLK